MCVERIHEQKQRHFLLLENSVQGCIANKTEVFGDAIAKKRFPLLVNTFTVTSEEKNRPRSVDRFSGSDAVNYRGNKPCTPQVYISNKPESLRLNLLAIVDSGLKQLSTLPQARAR